MENILKNDNPNSYFSSKFKRPGSASDINIKRPFKHPRRLSLKESKRQELLENVLKECDEIQCELSQSDIGPFFGLPSKVSELLVKVRGIDSLYEWQNECLKLPAVNQKKNLIYSLPTSGGKTLVAEILIMKKLLCKKQNCIFILPYISIVQEKVRDISPFAVELEFLVEEYAGSKGKYPPVKRRKHNCLYVATIEKASGLINSLIESSRLQELGLIVVDELHMIGDGSGRGALLETTLTKIMHAAPNIQIIGMSATLGSFHKLQSFLSAEVYCGNFRPVALNEYIKIKHEVWQIDLSQKDPEKQFKKCRNLSIPGKYDQKMKMNDKDLVGVLVEEVIPNSSCLVFCPTKKACENMAVQICRILDKAIIKTNYAEKNVLFNALMDEGNGAICDVLRYTLAYGVAYHHAGLTGDERKLLEDAYSAGTLCCLCATSTLAAGVNLPVKRVIIHTPYCGPQFLTKNRYKQMAGRAGRAGLDSCGESYLIIQPTDKEKLLECLVGPELQCQSSLMYNKGRGICSLVLSLIGLKMVKNKEQLKEFIKKTLHYKLHNDENCLNGVDKAITDLKDKEMISTMESADDQGCQLEATKLGRASFKASIDMDICQKLYKDLVHASAALCVKSHLHLLFLVTPYEYMNTINADYFIYHHAYYELSEEEQKVAQLIGINQPYVELLRCGIKMNTIPWYVAHRFYLTLILNDLWHHKSLWEVSKKFELHRGTVQNLLSATSSFATCVSHFCQEYDQFWFYQSILPTFASKLSLCSIPELIPLMELPAVKKGRAKLLYEGGYKTLEDIAKATADDISNKIQFIPKSVATKIISSAKMLLLVKAESLNEQVKTALEAAGVPFSI